MKTRITVFKSTQTFRLNFKKQLIEAEAARLGGFQSRQIITGQDSTPVEIAPGGRDFRTTQEEADTIMVAKTNYAAMEEKHNYSDR